MTMDRMTSSQTRRPLNSAKDLDCNDTEKRNLCNSEYITTTQHISSARKDGPVKPDIQEIVASLSNKQKFVGRKITAFESILTDYESYMKNEQDVINPELSISLNAESSSDKTGEKIMESNDLKSFSDLSIIQLINYVNHDHIHRFPNSAKLLDIRSKSIPSSYSHSETTGYQLTEKLPQSSAETFNVSSRIRYTRDELINLKTSSVQVPENIRSIINALGCNNAANYKDQGHNKLVNRNGRPFTSNKKYSSYSSASKTSSVPINLDRSAANGASPEHPSVNQPPVHDAISLQFSCTANSDSDFQASRLLLKDHEIEPEIIPLEDLVVKPLTASPTINCKTVTPKCTNVQPSHRNEDDYRENNGRLPVEEDSLVIAAQEKFQGVDQREEYYLDRELDPIDGRYRTSESLCNWEQSDEQKCPLNMLRKGNNLKLERVECQNELTIENQIKEAVEDHGKKADKNHGWKADKNCKDYERQDVKDHGRRVKDQGRKANKDQGWKVAKDHERKAFEEHARENVKDQRRKILEDHDRKGVETEKQNPKKKVIQDHSEERNFENDGDLWFEYNERLISNVTLEDQVGRLGPRHDESDDSSDDEESELDPGHLESTSRRVEPRARELPHQKTPTDSSRQRKSHQHCDSNNEAKKRSKQNSNESNGCRECELEAMLGDHTGYLGYYAMHMQYARYYKELHRQFLKQRKMEEIYRQQMSYVRYMVNAACKKQ